MVAAVNACGGAEVLATMGDDDQVVLTELLAGDCLPSTLSKRTGLVEPVVEGVVAGLVSKGWAHQSPATRSAAGVMVMPGRVAITPAGRRALRPTRGPDVR